MFDVEVLLSSLHVHIEKSGSSSFNKRNHWSRKWEEEEEEDVETKARWGILLQVAN